MIWIVREDGAVARMDYPRFRKEGIKSALMRSGILEYSEEGLKGLALLSDGPADAQYLRGPGDFSEWRCDHYRAGVMEQGVGERPSVSAYATPEEAVDMARGSKAVAEGEGRARRVWAVNDWENPTVTMWDSKRVHGIPQDEWDAVHKEANEGALRKVQVTPTKYAMISEAAERLIVIGMESRPDGVQHWISAFWEDYPGFDINVRGPRRPPSPYTTPSFIVRAVLHVRPPGLSLTSGPGPSIANPMLIRAVLMM